MNGTHQERYARQTRNDFSAIVAASADGSWRIAGDGQTLTMFDAAGRLLRSHMAAAADGSGRSAVTALHDAAPSRSLVVIFETLPEFWEISYDPNAEPIHHGLVHDYRLCEGIAEFGFLNPQRTRLDAPLRDAGFSTAAKPSSSAVRPTRPTGKPCCS